MNYQLSAENSLERAKTALDMNTESSFRYAALELRLVIEAMAYAIAESYDDFFPTKEYKTWQPDKLIRYLVEMEPTAKLDSKLYVVKEDGGQVLIGDQKRLNFKNTRKHYQTLGGYVHLPPLSSKSTTQKKYEKISVILKYLEERLSATLPQGHPSAIVEFQCHREGCNSTIRAGMALPTYKRTISCVDCRAVYSIHRDEKKAQASAHRAVVKCPNSDCFNEFVAWHDEVEVGKTKKCPKCSVEIHFVTAMAFLKSEEELSVVLRHPVPKDEVFECAWVQLKFKPLSFHKALEE